jgi:hypothetical protein
VATERRPVDMWGLVRIAFLTALSRELAGGKILLPGIVCRIALNHRELLADFHWEVAQ